VKPGTTSEWRSTTARSGERRREVHRRPLYRAKAALCLFLGLHYKNEEEPHGHYSNELCVVWWNGAMTGYYEPEWEEDNVHVGYGLGNWWVVLNVSYERRA
jgi:hypothetical protein